MISSTAGTSLAAALPAQPSPATLARGVTAAGSLSPAARAEIMKTRETDPAMSAADLKALADKHGVKVYKVRRLRALHAQLNGLPGSPGRPKILNELTRRELLLLLLLQREVTDAALADHFGIGRKAFWRHKKIALTRSRPNTRIDLNRLLRSMEGATP